MDDWRHLTTTMLHFINFRMLPGLRHWYRQKRYYSDLLCMCLIHQPMKFFTPLSFVVTDHSVAVTIKPLAAAPGISDMLCLNTEDGGSRYKSSVCSQAS